MTTTTPPGQPEPHPLDYEPRALPVSRRGPRDWMKVSIALGALSWATLVLMCAGVASPLAWIPVLLAAAGLAAGIASATRPLPRDATPDVFASIFMSISVLAIWLLALALL